MQGQGSTVLELWEQEEPRYSLQPQHPTKPPYRLQRLQKLPFTLQVKGRGRREKDPWGSKREARWHFASRRRAAGQAEPQHRVDTLLWAGAPSEPSFWLSLAGTPCF